MGLWSLRRRPRAQVGDSMAGSQLGIQRHDICKLGRIRGQQDKRLQLPGTHRPVKRHEHQQRTQNVEALPRLQNQRESQYGAERLRSRILFLNTNHSMILQIVSYSSIPPCSWMPFSKSTTFCLELISSSCSFCEVFSYVYLSFVVWLRVRFSRSSSRVIVYFSIFRVRMSYLSLPPLFLSNFAVFSSSICCYRIKRSLRHLSICLLISILALSV